MRILKVDSNNWSKKIQEIERNTIENVSSELAFIFKNEKGYIKHDKYKIYKDHRVIDGLKIVFVFTVPSKKIQNETFIYTMYTDIESDFYILEINLRKDTKIFKLNDYNKIIDFLIKDLCRQSLIHENELINKFYNLKIN